MKLVNPNLKTEELQWSAIDRWTSVRTPTEPSVGSKVTKDFQLAGTGWSQEMDLIVTKTRYGRKSQLMLEKHFRKLFFGHKL